MKIETIKLWEDREDVELTCFVNIEDQLFGGLENPVMRPAVIVCPGGAYQNCPRHGIEGDSVAMTYAVDGFQAFVLEYSIAQKAPQEKTLFPAQIFDLGKAFLTIREHAAEWHIDTEKIAVCGFSAGAHLCSMYASTWHEGLLAERFGCDNSLFRPMAAVLIYGIYDYVLQEKYNSRIQDGPFGEWNVPVFGCEKPDEETLKRYSPVSHVSEYMPPAFLAAATDDNLVSPMNTIRMAEKLQEMGRPYECHMFQYGQHGFALGHNLFEPFRKELEHACAQWVPLSKTFLMHLVSPDTLKADPFAK